jgi:cellulose synthase/poly-beta-1,6-N-acetylglucosamine synthase-like glycosyltransferase
MASFVSILLVVAALLLAIPVTLLFLEVIAALSLPEPQTAVPPDANIRQRVAVLVPAHNESLGILSTLEHIKAQLLSGDRLLVIADNCDDDTAAIAKATGAEIIERDEPGKRGKGYALDFGLKYLSLDPPAIVIVIDADCRVEKNAIDQLAVTCATTRRPVQVLDLMTAPDKSPINLRIAEFAWRVKNWVRPLGLNALNLPCQLMGTGMAFPWEVIHSANLASSSIVEDLKLGLELTRSGSSPLFCSSARVTSQFPLSVAGAKSQRERWEEGHISMILKTFPYFIYEAVARRNMDLLALTLDMAIPPLSLLVILLGGMSLVAGVAALFGFSSAALAISATCIVVLVLTVFLSWCRYGRDILPPSALISVASYIFLKLPIYRRLLSGGAARQWTRTDRKKNE